MFVAPDEDSDDENHEYEDENGFRYLFLKIHKFSQSVCKLIINEGFRKEDEMYRYIQFFFFVKY